MMPISDKAYTIDDLLIRLKEALPEWDIVSILEFGSSARDESVSVSDIDLWILVHQDHDLLLDRNLTGGRYQRSTERFLELESRRIVECDTWGNLRTELRYARPIELSCPIADARWFLFQLAGEQDWQSFMYSCFATPAYDPFGFLTHLQKLMWTRLPFHISADHGIILTLKQFCESEKLSLITDLKRIEAGQEIQVSDSERPVWLNHLVECIRDPLVLFTLVRDGYPKFRKGDILALVEDSFPDYSEAAKQAYFFKATDEGRAFCSEILTHPSGGNAKALIDLTVQIVALWYEIMKATDIAILEGCSHISIRESGWLEENQGIYGGLLDNLK